MRTLTLYRCNECSKEFVIGNRCKNGHKTFRHIGEKSVPDIKIKKTYRDRVLEAVSAGKFKDSNPRFLTHII